MSDFEIRELLSKVDRLNASQLKVHLKKVVAELSALNAERERVANGKLVCADCNSILARW